LEKALKLSSQSVTTGLTLGLTTLLIACGAEETPHSTDANEASAAVSATAQTIQIAAKDVGNHAMEWQLARMDDFEDYIVKMNHTAEPRNWVQGAFYIGLTQWVEATDSQAGLDALVAVSTSNQYELGDRLFHADDHAIGQTYLWLYERTGDKAFYGPTGKTFDEILAFNPTNSLQLIDKSDPEYEGSCQKRWCWSDALFMAPRTWLMLSNATGDPRYFEYGDKEYWATTDYLFSKEHGLYFRDSRYFDSKSANGAPVFWSRGNGWVFAGLPMILDDLPEEHPSRARYVNLYKTMAKRFVEIQKPDGYWAPSLMDAEVVNTPEVSGTGFITYGLAWGVNNGILTDEATINATKMGWAALEAAVDDDGMVHWVQQIGKSPDPVEVNHTQLYGVGAVLLAASEMLNWEK
jgi:rhamnogalacturonyl hydrolase YesR